MRGTVKWFNEEKGYGFVTGEDGVDAFVHINTVPEETNLTDGVKVEFEREQGPKGPRVKSLKLAGLLLLTIAAMCFLATAGGCSDLQARGPMIDIIDTNAQVAAETMPQAAAGALTLDTCIVKLAENSESFSCYAASKTTNFFAYAFGDKLIFCTPTYAVLLDKTAALAAETKSRATSQPAAWCNAAVAKESSVLIKVAQARAGKKE